MRRRPLIFLTVIWSTLLGGASRGDLIYVSREDNTITRIDSVTGAESTFASTFLSNPHGMAFDTGGNLYVANTGDHFTTSNPYNATIARFTTGGVGSIFEPAGAIVGPHLRMGEPPDVAFDASGNLYVSGDKTYRFTPGGVGSVFANASGLEIAFDSSGNLFAASNDRINKIAPDGTVSVFADLSSGLQGGAYGLTVDGAGNVFAYDYLAGELLRFTPGGVATVLSNSTLLYGIFGMEVDGAGNIFAANYSHNTIDRIAPDGTVTVFETGAAGRPLSLTILRSVPEPASLVMLGTGSAVLFIAYRRRRPTTGVASP